MGRWQLQAGSRNILKFNWRLLFGAVMVLVLSIEVKSQDFSFAPPTIFLDRHWSIPEDEPVGTRVAHAKTSEKNPNLEFSLQPSDYYDGSSFFRIDPKSGAIYLNETMEGKKGKQYYLKVSASSGQIPATIEIWVEITASKSSNIPYTPLQPMKPGSTVNHDMNGHANRPMFPPTLILPSNVVIPPTPPSNVPMPVTPEKPEYSISSVTPETIPPEPNNKLTEISTLEPSSKPNFPPHIINSNKNNIYDISYNGVSDHNKTFGIDNDNIQILNSTSNELMDMESSKQTTLNTTASRTNTTNNIVIFTIVPIVLIFGVVPIVVASIWVVRRRTRVKKRPIKEMRKESAATTNSSMTMSGEGESPNALKQWIKQAQSNRYESWNPDGDSTKDVNRWEFPRHHLQVGGILGEGCFGQVWKCEALNIDDKEGITTVAVKTLKESAGERERADLLSELAVMKMLDPHPHVVRLLGSCTDKDPIFLIMEYVALGKLQSYLRNSRAHHYYGNLHADSSSISSKDLTAFCYQIARGMEYLSSKGIIHRDLAARNILIDKDRVCKVADFGFARDVVANHVYERKTDGRLPVRWMAPEALYDNIFTTKTDIWSFGVLMWEIVTLGSTPYPGISAAEVMRKVREGYRLEKPEHCRRELYNIMFYCWAQNPDDRPTFSDLVNFLKHLLFSETDYIELDRFPDHDYYNMSNLTNSGEKL